MLQPTKYLSQNFVTEFIELYRLLPCLWKVKSSDYFNKAKKQAAYEELLEVCKKIDKNADVDFVKAKIPSFRGSFRKELRKVRASKRSGAGEEEVYVPKLWYYDLLLFTANLKSLPITFGEKEFLQALHHLKHDHFCLHQSL